MPEYWPESFVRQRYFANTIDNVFSAVFVHFSAILCLMPSKASSKLILPSTKRCISCMVSRLMFNCSILHEPIMECVVCGK